MRKRSNAIVVVSSDDDDFSAVRTRSSSISKLNSRNSKSTTSAAKSTKKKARLSHSLSSSAQLFSNFDEVNFISFTLLFFVCNFFEFNFTFCIKMQCKFLSGGLADNFARFPLSSPSPSHSPFSIGRCFFVGGLPKFRSRNQWFALDLTAVVRFFWWLQDFFVIIY